MASLNELDLELLPARKRGRLVNSLSGFKSVNLVGTANSAGVHNLSIVSSVVHLGSDPALMGVVFRPPVERQRGSHSYWNIRETGVFTLNHVTSDFYIKAHQASARYAAEIDEFVELGLTPVLRCGFDAPAVEESPVRMGLELLDEWTIEANGCRMMVGQIRWVEFPSEAWADDGYLDLESLDVVALSSLDGYHKTNKLSRLSYAKADEANPTSIRNFMEGWKD